MSNENEPRAQEGGGQVITTDNELLRKARERLLFFADRLGTQVDCCADAQITADDIRAALSTPQPQAPAGERPKVLMPPVAGNALPQDYLDGWAEGQTYFIDQHFPLPPASPDALREAADCLQVAEAEYRRMHDLHGDDSQAAGRAWDLMRRAGDKLRTALASSPQAETGDAR